MLDSERDPSDPRSSLSSGCNPSDPASYTPYPLSSNQSVKWSATSGTVKADFVGALNDFAYAPRTSTVRCYLMLENLRWGEVNTMPYSSVSYVTTFFTPTDLVYVLTLND